MMKFQASQRAQVFYLTEMPCPAVGIVLIRRSKLSDLMCNTIGLFSTEIIFKCLTTSVCEVGLRYKYYCYKKINMRNKVFLQLHTNFSFIFLAVKRSHLLPFI